MMSRLTRSKAPASLNLSEKFGFKGRSKSASVEMQSKVQKRKVDENSKCETEEEKPKTKKNPKLSKIVKKDENIGKTDKTCDSKMEESCASKVDDIEDCCKSSSPAKDAQEKVKWFPENWEKVLSNIREMRSAQDAPVDDMGCHKTMDPEAPPEVQRYQALVSLMLSSQTKDQTTYAAMLRLREHGLTVENILKTSDNDLAKLINTVGFWRRKVEYIKKTTEILKERYNSDIPNTIEGLIGLPGVGPKMAHLCMTTAWNKIHGIDRTNSGRDLQKLATSQAKQR